MLKELLNGRCRIRFEKAEMNTLEAPAEGTGGIEIILKDSAAWKKETDCFHVECTRHVGFEPACNLEVTVKYSVEHYLKEAGALDQLTDNEIESEFRQNLQFYIQEERGLMNRASLIIAQLTSAFDGVPLILPPYYQTEE